MRIKQYDQDIDLETTEVQSLKQKMGSGPLNTTAQQVIPAINEVKSSLSNEILWNDSKYTSGDIQLSSPLKNGDHIMLIFKGLSSAYIQQFPFIIDTTLSTYLQIGFWGDSTQYCRYRMQVANNSTTFTINEVINGNAGSALLRIVRTKKAS